jgi:hypothetical protein
VLWSWQSNQKVAHRKVNQKGEMKRRVQLPEKARQSGRTLQGAQNKRLSAFPVVGKGSTRKWEVETRPFDGVPTDMGGVGQGAGTTGQ